MIFIYAHYAQWAWQIASVMWFWAYMQDGEDGESDSFEDSSDSDSEGSSNMVSASGINFTLSDYVIVPF